jgi:hypothetical protein
MEEVRNTFMKSRNNLTTWDNGETLDWIYLTQNIVDWRALVNADLIKYIILLNRYCFSRTLPEGVHRVTEEIRKLYTRCRAYLKIHWSRGLDVCKGCNSNSQKFLNHLNQNTKNCD